MACVIETYTDELLFTNVGRRSLKVSKATAIRYARIFIVRETGTIQIMFIYEQLSFMHRRLHTSIWFERPAGY